MTPMKLHYNSDGLLWDECVPDGHYNILGAMTVEHARLFAASPELLEACRDALWRLGELEGSDAQHVDGTAQHRLRQAIALADQSAAGSNALPSAPTANVRATSIVVSNRSTVCKHSSH